MLLRRTAVRAARQQPVSAALAAPAARRAFSTAKADSVNVAAVDDGSATTTVTLALKAGPRYETQPGVSHALKNFLFKGNKKRSALHLIREAELYGGLLSTASTKEHLLLTAQFLRGDEEFFLEILGDALASPKFARHEFVEEVVPSLQLDYELAQSDPLVLGFDALTATAFRHKGVGASLFASPASPVSHAQTVAFARGVLAKSHIALLGTGIDAGKLASLASKALADVPASGAGGAAAAPKSASQYYGGEQRIAFSADHGVASGIRPSHGHFLLGFQGAATGANGAAELAVLRALLGGESRVKWASGQSPLAQLAASAQHGVQARAFNLGFSDAGLFGVQVSAPQERLAAVAKAAVNALKDVASGKGAGKDEVQRAIAQAKFEAAAQLESRSASHEALAGQLLETGKISTLDMVFSALDKVDAKSVQAAAEKALKSKPTAVAIGDVHKLPYADELL